MARPATAAVRLLTGEREPVRLATMANIALHGLQTIDGVAAEVGDRVLVKNQADASENGIYTASEGQWFRAADARTSRTMQKGTTVHVQQGTANASKTFVFNTLTPAIGDSDIEIDFYLSDDLVGDAVAALNDAGQVIVDAAVAAQHAAESAAGANLSNVDSRAVAILTTFPDMVNYVRTAGYATAGDGGDALYKRVASQPSHEGKFQSADGAWWEIAEDNPSVKMFGAKGDGATMDTVALKAALAFGKSLVIPAGIYEVDALLWPSVSGQKIVGDGIEITIIRNSTNNEPLFIFGDPANPDGAAQFAHISNLTFRGNVTGQTLWGIFCPNAPLVDGGANAAGQYEGLSNNSNNFYFGKLSFTPAEWTVAARGNSLSDVRVENVYGGYALHVSAWDFKCSAVQLWSGKRGLRNCGAANSNHYEDLYISSMSAESIIEPPTTSSIPIACSYDNCIVQQSGADDGGKGAIAIYKSQATSFRNLYLERNNEAASNVGVDIYLGTAAIGTEIGSIRYRNDNAGATIIRNQGQATAIGILVVSGASVKTVLLHDGTDARTSTMIRGPISGIDTLIPTNTDGVVTITGTASRKLYYLTPWAADGISFSSTGDKAYMDTQKVALRANGSSSRILTLESSGAMRFVTDTGNVTTGGNVEWYHNGEDALGTLLLQLVAQGGVLRPGTDVAQALGDATHRWSNIYAGVQWLTDGVAAPGAVSGLAAIYVDAADGDLKIKFGDGVVKTIVVDT